ncbi:MAG: HI0074 family nucleotidyltransferase substrate-binding subunit [Thermodesulfobacteriota bacterium]
MDRLIERYRTARQALATLEELLGTNNVSAVYRDAAIQRFEYTFESVWKAAKVYLSVVEGVEARSPKQVIRACFQIGLLSRQETERALVMVDDRNLTSHTYHEGVAISIYNNLPEYAEIMERWLTAMAGMLPADDSGDK